MSSPVTVQSLFDRHETQFKLSWLAGHRGSDRHISGQKYNLHQQALVGHLNLIHPNRIQIFGRFEQNYLNELDIKTRAAQLEHLFAYEPALVIIADQAEAPEDLVMLAEKSGTPLWSSQRRSSELISDLQFSLVNILAQRLTLHGVFMDIFGSGVLITGKSAIGKSELALELISRGHALVADDAPEFSRIAPDVLNGSCPPTLANFLEVRGLGILNIRDMYGDSAIQEEKNLHMILNLKPQDASCFESTDRLQPCNRTLSYLDVDVNEVTIPVAPGRNLAVLAEACVRNQRLQSIGRDAVNQISIRQRQHLNKGGA